MLKNKIIFVLTILLLFGETKADWKIIDSTYLENNGTTSAMNTKKIKCFDDGVCIQLLNIYGTLPWIKRSSNFGKTWETTYIDTSYYVNGSFYYPSDMNDFGCFNNDCIAVGDSNYYLISKDKAKSWTKLHFGEFKHTTNWNIVKCYEKVFLARLTNPKIIFKSNDKGKTWDSIKFNFPDSIGNYSLDNFTLIGDSLIKATIYLWQKDKIFMVESKDLGKSWKSFDFTPKRIEDFIFIDENNGFGIGASQLKSGSSYSSSYMARTKNGGKTWITVLDTFMKIDGGFTRIKFVDNKNGIAFGPYELWITKDGGNKWEKDTSYNEIRFPNGRSSDATLLKDGRILVLNSYKGMLWENSNWVTSVDDNSTKINNISYYPNPSKDYLNIKLNSEPLSKEELEIYNLMGQNLLSQKIENIQTSIDIQKLNTGIYYCKLKQNGTVFKFEVVK